MLSHSPPSSLPRRAAIALATGLAAAVGLTALPAAPAQASSRQIAIIQDQGLLGQDPAGTLSRMQALGATTVRVLIDWNYIAPKVEAPKKPRYNATNPNAYPAGNWTFFDTVIRDAKADGMTIDLTVTGGAPRWAEGKGIPSNYVIQHNAAARFFAWKPDAAEFGQFVKAVGKRYDGKFKPAGETSALPRVHFWTIWNEPNFGQDLGPQAIDTSRYAYAPGMYRNLVRSGYTALRQTGHARDTILIGELAAHGSALSMGRHGPAFPQGLPGNAAQSQPLPFMRALYCVSSAYHPLTGTVARNAGCPTTASGRRAFRRNNPGLFSVTGVGDHPYANDATPASDGRAGNPQWSTLPNLGRLESTLDSANRAWGSHKRYPIYNDEYGYITNPPQKQSSAVSVNTAARYINWAEYLTWREPRVASFDQYLIQDGSPNPSTGNGGFATGLYTSTGKPKPSLDAYRLPLWLPSATLKRPGRDKVWGEARPATWTGRATKRTQVVQVQFRAHGHGAWKTIQTVRSNTYFEVRPKFSASGQVRLRYTYPSATADPLLDLAFAGKTIVSRSQPVTVH